MIRVMELSDVSRVAEIHVYGWRIAYRGVISDDYLFRNMLVSTRMSYFENAIQTNAEESYVFDDGVIKAFLTIGTCRDIDKPESFELWESTLTRLCKGKASAQKWLTSVKLKPMREVTQRSVCGC